MAAQSSNHRYLRKVDCSTLMLPYFIEYNVKARIVCIFILQFYLKTLFMSKVGDCYLSSKVRAQYFSTIFNEKMCTLYSIKYGSL